MKKKTKAEQAADILLTAARKAGKDYSVFFQEWLLWMMEIFSLKNLIDHNANYNLIMADASKQDPTFSECLKLWILEVWEYQKRHQCVDFFGEVYEWYFQSSSKASRMGQYFTPYSIGNLMAKCMGRPIEKSGAIVCSEPSCGSGRNLLALWQSADWSKRHIWYAEDLDAVSVMMCALNMMINGMFGYVVCHNTLIPDDFIFAFAVNEVRDPIPCDYFSIRQISQEEFNIINPWKPAAKQSGPVLNQKSLFDYES